MKSYIVYVHGVEKEIITAANHNAAEKKAKKKWDKCQDPNNPIPCVSVAYTEI